MTEKNDHPQPGKHTVYAPPSDDPSASAVVISVEVGANEEVEWIWTHRPDGTSIVTGYEIREKTAARDA